MKRRAIPHVTYPPGFFTELTRKHNFPPGYVPTAADSHKGKSTLENSINAQAGRQASAEAGKGWKTGTISGLSKRRQADIDRNEKIRKGSVR